MNHPLSLLAYDLGAESGRAILGQFDGSRLQLVDIHRFPNQPVYLPDGMHWDALRILTEIKRGLSLVVQNYGAPPDGLGIDTWGVDFGLLDAQDVLIGNPYHYRDSRTDGMLEEAFTRMPRAEIFNQTGIQFMQLNSLYQLLSMVVSRSPELEIAKTFLTMPDLFNYWLTGRKACEFTIATTTQCYDPRRGGWAYPLLEALHIPTHIFPEIVQPGSVLATLSPAVADELNIARIPVIPPASHDTGSAVAAVPATGGSGNDFAWLSSGTWSIMGVESTVPVINEQTLAFNMTNEGGAGGTIRLSKNIMGLWLVQECRRTWARLGENLSYDELTSMAAAAPPLQSLVDPDAPDFLKPGDMPARILAFCARTHQPAPAGKGEMVRCILESLALKYRNVLEYLQKVLGRQLGVIHIVGGGTQNRLLSQFSADATGCQVITGPVEATATGNLLMQALALGHIRSLAEGRELVRRSFTLETFEPSTAGAAWDEAYERMLGIIV
jgi:rhamnulokinase